MLNTNKVLQSNSTLSYLSSHTKRFGSMNYHQALLYENLKNISTLPKCIPGWQDLTSLQTFIKIYMF
jgi:hypothetical protein